MSYRNLQIYQLAHTLAVEVHQMSLTLPKFERYEEGQQIRRSSKSVSSNIVEGYCRRRYVLDYIRFIVYAHGSCEETIEHLEFLSETGSLKNEALYNHLHHEYNSLGGKINTFLSRLS